MRRLTTIIVFFIAVFLLLSFGSVVLMNYVLARANRIVYSFEYWETDETRKKGSATILGNDVNTICTLINNSNRIIHFFSQEEGFDRDVFLNLYVNDWVKIKLLISRAGVGTSLRHPFLPYMYYSPDNYEKIMHILSQYTTNYRVIGPG